MAKPNIPHSHGTAGAISQSDAIPKVAQKGFISKAVDFVTGVPLKLAEYAVWTPIFGLIAGPVLSGVSKLEKIPGFRTIGGGAKSLNNRITDFMRKEIGQIFTGEVSKKIGTASQTVADAVGNGVNKAASVTGVQNFAPRPSMMRASGHLGTLKEAINKFDQNGFVAKDFRSAIDQMVKLAESQKGMSTAEFEPHKNAFLKLIEQNKNSLDKKEIKTLNRILTSVGKAANSHKNASIWGNLGQMFKAVPGAIKSSKVLPGVANAALIVLAVASLVRVVTNFFKNVAGLKAMSKDITGKETSTMDIFRGKVPDAIKDGRSKLIKSSAVSAVTDTVSLGLVTAMAVKGSVGALSFMGPQAVSMGINAMIGESSLQVYSALSQAHASGQKITGEAYAALIGATSHEIKARGGADSIFAKKMGEVYAAENASPAQVLREIDSGKFMEHINTLMVAAKTAPAAAAVVAAGSHVAALQKSSNPMEQKPVVGNHTAQLVANAGQATHALSGA